MASYWNGKSTLIQATEIMKKIALDGHYVFTKAPWLNWNKLSFGLDNGYIDKQGISDYVCDALSSNSSHEAFEIASLEPCYQYKIGSLLQSLIKNSQETDSETMKPWLFLTLSKLLEEKEEHEDPFQIVEELYADFGYPEEIAPLIRYMPLPEGEVGSEDRLLKNWEAATANYEIELKMRNNKSI
jgi:hypothetical protein